MTLPYDVITVGGGLAGSAVAKCLAENGYRALVLERERRFRDRVRGEQMRITNWLTELLYSTGHAADERRARVLPRLATEPQRAPDVVGLGPASPSDDATRRFVLGEDDA